jgi:hypothetical protein
MTARDTGLVCAALLLCSSACATTTSRGSRGVQPQHLVHQVPADRLRKIQQHNPILSPYHPNHYDVSARARAPPAERPAFRD